MCAYESGMIDIHGNIYGNFVTGLVFEDFR
jgi:hypothetical protein